MDTSNEAVFRRWIDEGLNRKNLEVLRDCRTEDFTWHGGGAMLGVTGYREWVLAYWAAFADLHAEMREHSLGQLSRARSGGPGGDPASAEIIDRAHLGLET